MNDENNLSYQQARGPRPLSEYSVSVRQVSGAGTQVSSLGSRLTSSVMTTSGSSHSSGETTVAMMDEEDRDQCPQDVGPANMEDLGAGSVETGEEVRQ